MFWCYDRSVVLENPQKMVLLLYIILLLSKIICWLQLFTFFLSLLSNFKKKKQVACAISKWEIIFQYLVANIKSILYIWMQYRFIKGEKGGVRSIDGGLMVWNEKTLIFCLVGPRFSLSDYDCIIIIWYIRDKEKWCSATSIIASYILYALKLILRNANRRKKIGDRAHRMLIAFLSSLRKGKLNLLA